MTGLGTDLGIDTMVPGTGMMVLGMVHAIEGTTGTHPRDTTIEGRGRGAGTTEGGPHPEQPWGGGAGHRTDVTTEGMTEETVGVGGMRDRAMIGGMIDGGHRGIRGGLVRGVAPGRVTDDEL